MMTRRMTGSRPSALAFLSVIVITAAMVSLKAEIFYPWKGTHIGALEEKEWFGLVLAPARGVFFGLRLRVQKDVQTAEGEDFFFLGSGVGPPSPECSYSP